MYTGCSVYQLGGDAEMIASLTHRAFEHIAQTKFSADPLHIDRLTFVSKSRIARDDEQPANAAQRSDDLLDQAVGEIL